LDQGKELAGRERFDAKGDIESLVLVFGVGVAAEYEDGKQIAGTADGLDELWAVHSGHQMIGNDDADGRTVAGIQKRQCLLAVEGHGHTISDALQDGLSCRGLERVIINQQNVWSHP